MARRDAGAADVGASVSGAGVLEAVAGAALGGVVPAGAVLDGVDPAAAVPTGVASAGVVLRGTNGMADVGGAEGRGGMRTEGRAGAGGAGAGRSPALSAGETSGIPASLRLAFSSLTGRSLTWEFTSSVRTCRGWMPGLGPRFREPIKRLYRRTPHRGRDGSANTAHRRPAGKQSWPKACNLGVRQIDQTFRGLTNANGDHLRSEYKRGSRHGARPSKGKSYQAGSGY